MSTSFVPLSVPLFGGKELEYVTDCVVGGWVSSVGKYVDQFEKTFADYLGAQNAVATCSGTAALHVALMIVGVQAGDEVLVSDLTFIAPVNAIKYVGAHPILIDAEARHAQMDVSLVRDFLKNQCRVEDGICTNTKTNRKITAILPVHVLGHPVNLLELKAVAEEFHLRVVEDATESLGTRYEGRFTGTWGDVGCFSFNGNKIITTGGGGMVVTNRLDWAKRAKHLTTQAKSSNTEYEHDEVGYNYRLTNIQAALGCGQMEQLDSFVARRRQIFQKYQAEIGGIPGITLIGEPAGSESNAWLTTIQVEADTYGMDARSLRAALDAGSIQARTLWRPMHMTGAHSYAVCVGGEVAKSFYEQALSLPSSAAATDAEISRVAHIIKSLARRAVGNR